MHLVYILLIIVSALTILSAFTLIFGSTKSERARGLWFLVAAIGSAIWGLSISLFLSLGTGEFDYTVAPWLIKGIYAGAIIMDVALLGYISWKYKLGKIITSLFSIGGAVLLALFMYDPSILYSSITLSNAGNSIAIDFGHVFYLAYSLFFCTITPVFCSFLIYQIKHSRSKKSKKGHWAFLIGLAIAGLLSLIFDIILPPVNYSLIWVGPLSISLALLAFYYAILRFKLISLSTSWMRVMSYVVILGSALIIYLLIFHLVFSALFRIANPSFQVILLNFVMIAIVLLLMPAISEVNSLTKSLIMTKQIDLAYVVKKITVLNRNKLDLKELSGFLAEHIHFSYVGFLINGKFYGSDDFRLPPEELIEISSLKMPEKGMWQNTNGLKKDSELDISRVGVLTNTNGERIGQVILGKPTSKSKLDKKDLAEVEMIFNLITVMVENGSRNA